MVISKGILRLCFSIIILITALPTSAQNIKDDISTAFEEYQKVPASNIYLHLNKSIVLQGENLGFTAYVFDHKKQLPSKDVTNLYCQILDSNRVVVKEKLLKVENGLATDVFVIDSLLSRGNYTIRGFTNWMKNFENPQYFESSVQVLSSSNGFKKKQENTNALDIQILPESGHLLENVLNRVGVSIKTKYGTGVKEAEVSLIENGQKISTILLDKNGHGRFSLIPKLNNFYKLEISHDDQLELQSLPQIESKGITMSVNQINEQLFVELKTNEKTLKDLNGDTFILAVNGSDIIELFETKITDLRTLLSINLEELKPGVNQVTLLTKERKVIGQRLIYNYSKSQKVEVERIEMSRVLDTINTIISIDREDIHNISVSVLPVESVAIDNNLSILSKFKLQPYIKGTIENPRSYFQETSPKSKFEMDNLLLCQGWTMYDWDDIFNPIKSYRYGFENGISVTAKLNGTDSKEFMIFPNRNSSSTFVELENNEDFIFGPYFPTDGEKLRLSALDKKGKSKRTKLFPQFSPRIIPDFLIGNATIPLQLNESLEDIDLIPFTNDSEQLDAITLSVQKDEDRELRIKDRARGRVDIFDDSDRRNTFNIIQYLNRNGFQASFSEGTVTLVNNRFGISEAEPLIVINEVAYRDPNILQGFDMSIIDYIEFDFSGLSQYGRAPGGLIHIRTDPRLTPYNKESKSFSSYEIPLTFSLPTKFYKPTYYSYNDDLFNKLGVIDWQGSLNVTNGIAQFKMPYLGKNEMLLHIQGWTTNGQLIDQITKVQTSN